MRLLFCGDVMGKSGRAALLKHLPDIKRRLDPHLIVVNGENAAHGFGITGKICESFYAAGVDVITTGNHVWDQREMIGYIDQDRRVLRPLNFKERTPGRGAAVYEAVTGKKVLVIQVIGRLFMANSDDPFEALDKALEAYPLGRTVDAVIVDVHAEASSEKAAMAFLADGRASMVVGTHTHIPTADARILTKGTAFQMDVGMCGDYDSVIGMEKAEAIRRFRSSLPGEKLTPAEGEGTVCGLFVETDDRTGLAVKVEPLRLGGVLA